MHAPKTLHAEGWPPAPCLLDDVRAQRGRGQLHVMLLTAAAVAASALLATSGLDDVADEPQPLDLQVGTLVHDASAMLTHWQQALSRGLQVSLRAVADGKDSAAALPPEPQAALAEVRLSDTVDRDQPVRPDLRPQPH